MKDDMRSWSPELRRNFGTEQFAEWLNELRSQVFGLPLVAFADLDAGHRAYFRAIASRTLDDMDPQDRPGEPGDYYFELSVDLTRAAFAPKGKLS